MTHLLKLFDKVCKHEMDPGSFVKDTESRHDSVHRRTDGQTDRVEPVYPPLTSLRVGYKNAFFQVHIGLTTYK